jgi:hypothetical protein
MRKYYLVSTKHLEDSLWFWDNGDFVLYGARPEVESFVNCFKGRFSKYLREKYKTKEFLRRNGLDIKEISEEEVEALERASAYVQMNCVAANICLYPGQYPWGTGSTFFKACSPTSGCRRLGDLSGRERRRLRHSRVASKLPDDWLLSSEGFVLPDLLQSLFQKPAFIALSAIEQAETLRQIRFRFSAGVHQAARVCGITYADAARLLDTA